MPGMGHAAQAITMPAHADRRTLLLSLLATAGWAGCAAPSAPAPVGARPVAVAGAARAAALHLRGDAAQRGEPGRAGLGDVARPLAPLARRQQ